MNEYDLTDELIKWAKRSGWLAAHFRPARTKRGWRTPVHGNPGFFDLVLIHEKTGRTILSELKSERGSLSDDQKRWRDAAQKRNDWRLWRPRHLEEVVELMVNEGR